MWLDRCPPLAENNLVCCDLAMPALVLDRDAMGCVGHLFMRLGQVETDV
jgi:hypothetical protein